MLPAALAVLAGVAAVTELASIVKKNSTQATLQSLLASALAISSLGHKASAQTLEDDQLNYRYSEYDEDALPDGVVLAGDPARYQVETHQFRLVKSLGEKYSLSTNLVHETMSGSSPWYVLPSLEGPPLQVLSGPTIEDTRNEFRGKLTRLDETGSWSVELGMSKEDDYQAKSISLGRNFENADKSRTWEFSGSISVDDLEPTDAELLGRVKRAEKDSYSLYAGLTQVINRDTLLQVGLQLSQHDGYLSDPYKMVFVGNLIVADTRPGSRTQYAASARLRYYVDQFKAALHINYRYFRDDWSIAAHTLDLSWNQKLPAGWRLSPSIRYHSQESASFYAPFFSEAPASGVYSSDYRLATYGALSYRLSVNKNIGDWDFTISAEIYDSDESLALSGTRFQTPGLVDFNRFTVGFNYRF